MIFWCIWEWFLSVKNVFLIWFSLKCLSLKFRVLRVKELVCREWESGIFIDNKNRACEKISLPLKCTIGGFIRWPSHRSQPSNWTREEQGNNGGLIRRFRNRPSNHQIKPERINQSGMNGGFVRRPDHNRRSPTEVKSKEKPRAFSEGSLRAKPSTF